MVKGLGSLGVGILHALDYLACVDLDGRNVRDACAHRDSREERTRGPANLAGCTPDGVYLVLGRLLLFLLFHPCLEFLTEDVQQRADQVALVLIPPGVELDRQDARVILKACSDRVH